MIGNFVVILDLHLEEEIPDTTVDTMRQLYLTTVCICLVIPSLRAQIATSYDLAFAEAGFNGNTFCVEIMLSFDQASNKLGSSNLVFDFDKNVIDNPTLTSQTLSGAPIYFPPSLTTPSQGRASFNVELGFPNFGDAVAGSPNQTLLARVCFDYPIPGQIVTLTWYENGTSGTVVFLDDESTRLTAGTLQDYSGIPASFPVEWLDFQAALQGADAQLDWTTGSELNNQHFEVERSLDGQTYFKVGQVQSLGNGSTTQAYQFLDPGVDRLGQSNLFYRLKQVDLDGAYSYSQVVQLSLRSPQLQVNAYPNPLQPTLHLQYQNPAKEAFRLQLVNALGQVIWTETEQAVQGQLKVDTQHWPAGIYYLSVESESQRFVHKLLKR